MNKQANDGRTTRTSQFTDEELIRVISSLNMKIDYLNQQNLQLGLYVEWITTHLQKMKDHEGNPLLDLDMTEFPEFAERRFKEVQEEIAQRTAQMQKEEAEAVLEEWTPDIGIDLGEEDDEDSR